MRKMPEVNPRAVNGYMVNEIMRVVYPFKTISEDDIKAITSKLRRLPGYTKYAKQGDYFGWYLPGFKTVKDYVECIGIIKKNYRNDKDFVDFAVQLPACKNYFQQSENIETLQSLFINVPHRRRIIDKATKYNLRDRFDYNYPSLGDDYIESEKLILKWLLNN